jgi:hypothetical protein
MWRRFRTGWIVSGGLVLVLAVVFLVHDDRLPIPEPEAGKVDQKAGNDDQKASSAELFLPSTARQGNWGNAEEVVRWEEMRRQIGIELSHRKESGPVRCELRIRKRAATRAEPELEVQLTNTSDDSVTIHIHQLLLDNVTFVFRRSDDQVVSSSCCVTKHSTKCVKPPMILDPHESKTAQVFLWVAADHGFQELRPGIYSLEAIFHDKSFFFTDLPYPDQLMLARSNRVAVRVGEVDIHDRE